MQKLDVIDGTYCTAARRISWIARCIPSVVFHAKFLWIVMSAGFVALRKKYDDAQWHKSSMKVFRALESVGVEFEVSGLNNLAEPDGPCLLIGNHMSTLETCILPGVVVPYRRVTFVVKAPLLDYPVFKHVMRSRDPIAVSQNNPREDLKAMLIGGVERLGRGLSLIIFPQGERTVKFNPQQFNSIGVKLAGRADVPIVPVALETSAWGLGRFISDFGRINPSRKVYIKFGEPVEVVGRGEQQQAALIDFIESHLRKWGAGDLIESN